MSARTLTQAELLAEAQARFGDEPLDFAFRCPNCSDKATIRDFKEAGADPGLAGQECIGRSLGCLKVPMKDWKGRGCDWVAYGLLRGPWTIVMPDGHEAYSFPLAGAS